MFRIHRPLQRLQIATRLMGYITGHSAPRSDVTGSYVAVTTVDVNQPTSARGILAGHDCMLSAYVPPRHKRGRCRPERINRRAHVGSRYQGYARAVTTHEDTCDGTKPLHEPEPRSYQPQPSMLIDPDPHPTALTDHVLQDGHTRAHDRRKCRGRLHHRVRRYVSAPIATRVPSGRHRPDRRGPVARGQVHDTGGGRSNLRAAGDV